MSPKEKAQDLVEKFLRTYKVSLFPPFTKASDEAIQCAIIAVEEILDAVPLGPSNGADILEDFRLAKEFWQSVLSELRTLA
jgi:hypothetical protein